MNTRKRIDRVSISRAWTFITRTNDPDNNGDNYRLTPASQKRLERAVRKHMHTGKSNNGAAVYEREVTK